jgi:hypothetical protein
MKYLILLSGKLRSGKNQLCEYLTDDFQKNGLSVKQDLYAKDLKDACAQDFKILSDVINQHINSIKSSVGVFFDMHDKISISAQDNIFNTIDKMKFKDENFYEDKTDITRALLQLYGTDIFRNRVDENYWMKKLAERINNDSDNDVIIITDVRFPNELEDIHDFIKGRRIVSVRINRPMNRNSSSNEHVSETALDDYTFWEYIVDNEGTLEDLKNISKYLSEDIMNIKE